MDNPIFDNEESASPELDVLNRLVEISFADSKLSKASEISDGFKTKIECSPPPFCTEFQAARLFLSHLGFLPLESQKVKKKK